MENYVQEGHTLDLAPGADVAAGVGYLFGAALFGVAIVDATSGVASSFLCHGIVEIAKPTTLVISVGDVLYWDATNKYVDKTDSGQVIVGVAVAAAANPSSTVKMRILPVAT